MRPECREPVLRRRAGERTFECRQLPIAIVSRGDVRAMESQRIPAMSPAPPTPRSPRGSASSTRGCRSRAAGRPSPVRGPDPCGPSCNGSKKEGFPGRSPLPGQLRRSGEMLPDPAPAGPVRRSQASAGTASAQFSTVARIASAEYEETVTVSRPMVTV